MEKKLIRVGVWETNSSSSHSLSLGSSQSKDFVLDTIYPDEEGKIYINGGEFGWEWNKFNDSMTKANYAAQQLENSDMDNFIEVIKEVTGAEEVVIDLSDGYVDHDSMGLVSNNKEWLKDFIFNSNSWCFTGNDNSSIEDSFYEVPTYKEDGEVIPVVYNYTLQIPIFGINVDFVDEPDESKLQETIDDKLWNFKLDKNNNTRDRYDRNSGLWMYIEHVDFKNKEILFFDEDEYEKIRKSDLFKDISSYLRTRHITKHLIETYPDLIKKIPFNLIEN